jgi:hydroxymethylpyrimidine/phosphomethylpyrimidine kinase
MSTPAVALTIAGTDSGGAAGIAADLATFAALGLHGACAITAVTAQDTTGVHAIIRLGVEDVRAQIEAVLDDLPVAVVKTGMLGAPGIAELVATLDRHIPLVVDPVLVATSGAALGDDEMVRAYRDHVLPRATVITPNLDEAVRLAGAEPHADPEDIAQALHAMGPAVVLTGGDPTTTTCRDVLVDADGRTTILKHAAIVTTNDHGTGCTFSAALAAGLAHGHALDRAARAAQGFVAHALEISRTWRLGRGRGPVAHLNPSPLQES